MRGLIKFIGIPDIELLNSRQGNLSEDLAFKLLNERGYNRLGAYLVDLISNEVNNTIAADYEVIKHFEPGSRVFLSSLKQDWYDNSTLIDNWFKAENPEYYRMDLDCEVSHKSIIGNYYVLNLNIVDMGYLISANWP